MKTFLKIALGLFFLVVAAVIGGGIFIAKDIKPVGAIKISPINKEALADGEYIGKYNEGRFSNELKVIVKDQKITDIIVLKPVTFERADMTKALIKSIIEKQDTDVDVISGATLTSNAYLKSVENALTK